MEEKKNELGTVTVSVEGKDESWKIASMLVGSFKGGRRVAVGKTDHDTYILQVKKLDENGNIVEHGMHLTKESLSALMHSILLFLEEEKENLEEFNSISLDEDSGYLYKQAGEEEL